MAYEPTREWNALAIAAVVMYRYMFFVIALVVVFIVCTARHIDMAPVDADRLVSSLGHFWVHLPAQYEAIKLAGGDVSAGNYAVFNFILLSTSPVLLVCTAYYYNKVRKKCDFPKIGNKIDIRVGALLLIGGIVFVIMDYPKEHPGFFGFRADAHGLYYFRQAFFSMAIILGPMMLVILLMKLAVGFPDRKDER
jgi:hypothetical protein